jgi:hypothetical protein
MLETKIVTKFPSPSAPVYVEDPAYVQYMKETYIDTGRVTITHENSRSETGITQTVVSFASDADKTAWETDPRLLENVEKKKAHNELHGIARISLYDPS